MTNNRISGDPPKTAELVERFKDLETIEGKTRELQFNDGDDGEFNVENDVILERRDGKHYHTHKFDSEEQLNTFLESLRPQSTRPQDPQPVRTHEVDENKLNADEKGIYKEVKEAEARFAALAPDSLKGDEARRNANDVRAHLDTIVKYLSEKPGTKDPGIFDAALYEVNVHLDKLEDIRARQDSGELSIDEEIDSAQKRVNQLFHMASKHGVNEAQVNFGTKEEPYVISMADAIAHLNEDLQSAREIKASQPERARKIVGTVRDTSVKIDPYLTGDSALKPLEGSSPMSFIATFFEFMQYFGEAMVGFFGIDLLESVRTIPMLSLLFTLADTIKTLVENDWDFDSINWNEKVLEILLFSVAAFVPGGHVMTIVGLAYLAYRAELLDGINVLPGGPIDKGEWKPLGGLLGLNMRDPLSYIGDGIKWVADHTLGYPMDWLGIKWHWERDDIDQARKGDVRPIAHGEPLDEETRRQLASSRTKSDNERLLDDNEAENVTRATNGLGDNDAPVGIKSLREAMEGRQ